MKELKLILLLLIAVKGLHAQNATLTEVDNVNFTHVAPIKTETGITGYYALVKSKKKNKGQETWSLNVFNGSLELIKAVDVLKPKGTVAVQSVCNGSGICILFAHQSDKTLECDIYDLTGNLAGTYQPVLSDIEKQNLKTLGTGFDPAGSIISIPNKGFVRVGVAGSLEAISNKGVQLWKWEYERKSEKAYARTPVLYMANNYLFTCAEYRFKKEFEWQLFMIDLSNGKPKAVIDCKRENGTSFLSPFGVKYDENKKNYMVYGVYGVNNDPGDYYRKGIYFQRISDEGTVTEEKMIDWENEVKPMVPEKTMNNTLVGAGTFFLDINLMPDGSIELIGERYARKMNIGVSVVLGSGGGGSDGPSATLSVDDGALFIFNFNVGMKLERIEQVEKKMHDALSNTHEGSSGDIGPGLETNKLVAFDYLFMTGPSDAPHIVYLDIDKIKSKEAEYKIRSATLSKQSISNKKEVAVTGNTGFFKVLQGPKGKAVIAEFLSKTNELKLRTVEIF